jgi:hypothetical protein
MLVFATRVRGAQPNGAYNYSNVHGAFWFTFVSHCCHHSQRGPVGSIANIAGIQYGRLAVSPGRKGSTRVYQLGQKIRRIDGMLDWRTLGLHNITA